MRDGVRTCTPDKRPLSGVEQALALGGRASYRRKCSLYVCVHASRAHMDSRRRSAAEEGNGEHVVVSGKGEAHHFSSPCKAPPVSLGLRETEIGRM